MDPYFRKTGPIVTWYGPIFGGIGRPFYFHFNILKIILGVEKSVKDNSFLARINWFYCFLVTIRVHVYD